jgi:hypothetical protein
MSRFRVFHPHSAAASFVAGIVGPEYELFDSELPVFNAWCPDRGYIAPVGRIPESIGLTAGTPVRRIRGPFS